MDNENPLDRAKRALQNSQSRHIQPAAPLLDKSKADALLARARAAVEDRPRPADIPKPAAPPAPERVRVEVTCGATGRKFIEIAERDGSVLRFAGRHEFPQPGQGGGAPAGLLSGSYRIETAAGWACPICRTGISEVHRLWLCDCREYAGAVHCGGAVDGARYCACGVRENRHLVDSPSVQVRGESIVSAPRNMRTGWQIPSAPPALPRGPASDASRLTWRR
jgi:hypothetical protein